MHSSHFVMRSLPGRFGGNIPILAAVIFLRASAASARSTAGRRHDEGHQEQEHQEHQEVVTVATAAQETTKTVTGRAQIIDGVSNRSRAR